MLCERRQAPGVFGRQLLEARCEGQTRRTPRCPEVHYHESFLFFNCTGECVVGYDNCMFHDRISLRWLDKTERTELVPACDAGLGFDGVVMRGAGSGWAF